MEFQPNHEIMAADESDVRRTVIAIQHLLNNFGEDSSEYGVDQVLGYSYTHLEKYQLSPTETEFIESERDVIIQSIYNESREYEKGIYVYVWKDIGPDIDELLPGITPLDATYQRFSEYRFSLSNEAWVSEEFQIEPDDPLDESVWEANPPAVELLHVSSKDRRAQVKKIYKSLENSRLTVTEIIDINQLLVEFNPANTIDISSW